VFGLVTLTLGEAADLPGSSGAAPLLCCPLAFLVGDLSFLVVLFREVVVRATGRAVSV
jgi:hypothetical protein